MFEAPFEIHVTIEHCNVDHFKRYCGDVGVKPLLIELQREGYSESHMMCSWRDNTTYGDTMKKAIDITKFFTERSLVVQRVKVETTPRAPKELVYYYETHIPAVIYSDGARWEAEYFAKNNNWHLSKNVFKKFNGGDVQFLTYRTFDAFNMIEKCAEAKYYLLKKDIPLFGDKIEREACVLDTAVQLDDNWLGVE